MDWSGGPGVQFVATAFGVIVAALREYGYYTGRVSRSGFTFLFVGVAALLAYGIGSAATVLSLPQFVSDLLAGFSNLLRAIDRRTDVRNQMTLPSENILYKAFTPL